MIEQRPLARGRGRELTPAQTRLFDAVEEWVNEKGVPPTYAELAAVLGVTKNAVGQGFAILERKRWITRRKGAPRSLVITGGRSVAGVAGQTCLGG